MGTNNFTTIDEYISSFPEEIQKLLQTIREEIHNVAPEAEETISYGMPAFKQNGILVYFAAFKNHIGFYPTSSGIEAVKEKLSGYKFSKGAVQFPINKPLPLDLIADITKFRLKENLEKKNN